MSLVTEDLKDLIYEHGTIEVRDFIGTFHPVCETEVRCRVHWVHPWIDPQYVRKAFEQRNFEVVTMTADKSTVEGLEHTRINTYSVVLRGEDIRNVPYLLRVVDENFSTDFECLVTMQGRAPVCLRCRQPGHVRSKCTAPFCSSCRNFGHVSANCQPNYAASVQRNRAADRDADMDEATSMAMDTQTHEGSSQAEGGSDPSTSSKVAAGVILAHSRLLTVQGQRLA